MILVAGGTGTLGRSLLPLLLERGETVRVLTRGERPDNGLSALGVEVVIGDVRDKAAVADAMIGVSTVVSAIQGFGGPGALGVRAIDRDGNANLIDAARVAGVERFILLSIGQAAADHPIELFRMKAFAEDRLKASGLAWTIFRPTAYQELWLEIVGRPLVATGRTRIFGRGRNPINFVSADDVARQVARAVADPATDGRTIDVVGPDNLTFDDFVGVVRDVTGATGTVSHVPVPAMRLMSLLLRPVRPILAGQIAAGVVMDTRDMTADTSESARRALVGPATHLGEVADRQLGAHPEGPRVTTVAARP